ncbi:hypothetical protein TARUN_7754 [Trichoderma arundinaceum]|uniref:Uncharacterized protein n=1 Tax=Trichoderma arundinaceum TaxID=490622 RepID=A0A395NFF3_TRIAR|nr:hypothetical protein TARUN_7754 [Trichoderma arundinaceum]
MHAGLASKHAAAYQLPDFGCPKEPKRRPQPTILPGWQVGRAVRSWRRLRIESFSPAKKDSRGRDSERALVSRSTTSPG